ncbi:MAG: CHAD domain-containing protein [Frankia sp.]
MSKTHRESERKFEVDAEFRLPSLTDVRGVAAVGEPETFDLEAVYFDSDDLRLARRKITLRRRLGGRDEGWHLKLPVAADVRDEIHRPLAAGIERVEGRDEAAPSTPTPESPSTSESAAGSAGAVPADLLDLVDAYLRGAPVRPVVTLRTRRTARILLDGSGRRLAEVVDDHVTSIPVDDPDTGSQWREIEVELVKGGRRLLNAVGDALLLAGAAPASSASKAARALGPTLERLRSVSGDGQRTPTAAVPGPAGGTDPALDGAVLGLASPAIAVVMAYVTKNVEALTAADPRVRLDVPDAVHKMRVAARRLRSTLRTFEPLFDQDRARTLDNELRDLAAALSGARDNEVLIEHFDGAVAALPPELVVGPVADRIHEHLTVDGSQARNQVLATLRDERYRRLLGELDDLIAHPVSDGPGYDEAGPTLARLVRHADRRLTRKIDRIRAAEPGADRDEAFHSARKQAKRLRYAAEAVTPLWGEPAADFAGLASEVQDVLGTRQDAAVARELLTRWGIDEQKAGGPSSFTLGLLLGREECRTADAGRDFDALWAKASRRRHRRWLRGG